ncbi:MAG TPA: response regulator [Bryobacteraceae bacterium]|nr:response regulator [Bryobacteraceae bacterium]
MRTDSILIVDDTPVNLKLVRVLLSRQGFDVRTASTAEEALEMVQTFRPSLVLADIQLPGMDGLEMTRRLKAEPKTSGIVVLALTAFAMKGDEQKAFEAGCDGYITKPIDTRSFPALIRQYLSKSNGSAVEPPPADTPVTAPATQKQTQQAFLAEGMQQSGRLISSLGSGFDSVEALSVVQRWASNAGSAGFPEISHYARELENLLQQNGRGSMVRTRELLVRLARAFAESMG